MTKTEYAEYIQSEYWQQRRKEVIADADHMCERCSLPRWVARLAYDQDLNVHHLNYQHLGCEGADDLSVLCRRCHDIETFGRSNYREIKTAECSLCRASHFNVYDDRCEKCRILFPRGEEELFFFNFSRKNENEEPFWSTLLREFWLASQYDRVSYVGFATNFLQGIAAEMKDALKAQ